MVVVLVPACAGAAQRGQALADTVVGSTAADPDPALVEIDPAAALVGADPVASSQDEVASTVQAASASAPAPSDRLTAVERALADGDICGVYDGLTNYDIAATSAQRFVAQLATIRDAMAGAASIVGDSDLHADWDVMTEATGEVVTALTADPFAMEAAAHVYDDPAYQAAQERVETWMEDNCG